MVKTGVHVVLAAALCLGPVAGQDTGRGSPVAEQSPALQRFRAVLEEQVTGDPRAALASLEAALPEAEGGTRAELLGRMSVLYRRLGEADLARETLEQLAAMGGVYREWARAELGVFAPSGQDPQATGELRNMIQHARAYRDEIRKLGSLAIPAIVEALDRGLDVHTARTVMELIISYEDPRVTAVVERMLASEDPMRQIVAAEFLPRLSGAGRREIALQALESEASVVRLHAVEALAGARDLDEVLRPALESLVRDPAQAVREKLPGLIQGLASEDLPIDAWLEKLIRDERDSVRRNALNHWLWRRGPEESDRRIALFERLPPAMRGAMAQFVLGDQRFTDEALLVRAMDQAHLIGRILGTVRRDALAAAPDFLRAALQVERGVHATTVLGLVREARVGDLLPETVSLLTHPSEQVRRRAFTTVWALDVQPLLDRAASLASDPELADLVAALLVEHGRPEDVPIMVELYNHHLQSRIIAESNASHLDAILDLVSVPERDSWWESRTTCAHAALERWFGPESIPAALARIRAIDAGVAWTILRLAEAHAGPEHVEIVTGLLAAMRREGLEPEPGGEDHLTPLRRRSVAQGCVRILAAVGGGQAAETLRDLLRDPFLDRDAFRALMAMEGAPRRELLEEALTDPVLWRLVPAALGQPEAAEDEDLRAAGERRVLGWEREGSPISSDWLRRLPEADRRRICTAILERIREGLHHDTQLAAVEVLGEARDPELVPTLALALRSDVWTVRRKAVYALRDTFAKEAAPHLIEALKDGDSRVLEAAQTSLARLSEYFEEKEKWEKAFGIKKDG